MKSAILTSTPVKERLEKEAAEKETKILIKVEKTRKRLYKLAASTKSDLIEKKEKKKKIIPKRRVKIESESEEEDDALCLVCLESYANSKPGQDWIQCMSCKKWAHIECGKDSKIYTCIHCTSDFVLSDCE